MAIVVEDVTPMLSYLIRYFPEEIENALEHIGASTQGEMQKRIRNYQRGSKSYLQKYRKNGYRRVKQSERGFYNRYKNGVKEHGYDKFVRSRVYTKSGKVIIGWMDTKAFINTKGEKVSGATMKKIGTKFELGHTQSLTPKMKAMFKYSGLNLKRSIVRKAKPIISPTYNAHKGRIKQIAMQEVDRFIGKSANGS